MNRPVGRTYRGAVFALLAALLAISIGVASQVANLNARVRESAASLLDSQLPAIHHFSEFESALLLHQLAMNKYFARSISHERFLLLNRDTWRSMELHLGWLEKNWGHRDGLETIRRTCIEIEKLSPQMDEVADSAGAIQNGEAVLLELNRLTRIVRAEVDDREREINESIARASQEADKKLDMVAVWVAIGNAVAGLTAAFMIYHVWARLRSEDELGRLAGHDALTGLQNRRSLEARLARLRGEDLTLHLIGVDRFARVLASAGHSQADHVIVQVADRLKTAAQSAGGEVFRLEGVVFAVLYPGRLGLLPHAISTLSDGMRSPFRLGRHEVFLTVSIGSVQSWDDGVAVSSFMRKANAALQAAERAGGARQIGYTTSIHVRTLDQLDMEADLQRAIERAELEVHFQPQMNLRSGKVIGFEALLRWRREGKLIAPDQFIPMAEETGLIVPIGAWVLEQACRQSKAWNSLGLHPVKVAVNVSALQLQRLEFVGEVEATLLRTGADASMVELEITESAAMDDPERVEVVIEGLRKLGISLAIDDFGTGYSSLAYLKKFRVQKLKIDRSFISEMSTEGKQHEGCIVQNVIDLGHSLGLEVIAEGVETVQQRSCLQAMGCDEIQGYFCGKPMPADEAVAFLDQRLNALTMTAA